MRTLLHDRCHDNDICRDCGRARILTRSRELNGLSSALFVVVFCTKLPHPSSSVLLLMFLLLMRGPAAAALCFALCRSATRRISSKGSKQQSSSSRSRGSGGNDNKLVSKRARNRRSHLTKISRRHRNNKSVFEVIGKRFICSLPSYSSLMS